MSVGDINSTARGSGARYNDGKPDMSLIPLDIVARSFTWVEDSGTKAALEHLGEFQKTGAVSHLDRALLALIHSWGDCARVFEYGKEKYAAWNWAKGMAWSVPIACAARHALKELNGEFEDQESGLPHVGHLMCNLVMLRTYVDTYPEGNDLPNPELFAAAPKADLKEVPPLTGTYEEEKRRALERFLFKERTGAALPRAHTPPYFGF